MLFWNDVICFFQVLIAFMRLQLHPCSLGFLWFDIKIFGLQAFLPVDFKYALSPAILQSHPITIRDYHWEWIWKSQYHLFRIWASFALCYWCLSHHCECWFPLPISHPLAVHSHSYSWLAKQIALLSLLSSSSPRIIHLSTTFCCYAQPPNQPLLSLGCTPLASSPIYPCQSPNIDTICLKSQSNNGTP